MEEKKYMIDNKPASARDIIRIAREYSQQFDESGLYQTSVAAAILRGAGHTVTNNPDYKE